MNQSTEETPLAPLTGVTEPLADGLGTVSDGLADASAQDPTPISNLLAETIGQEQEGYTNDQEGVVGVVSNLSQGLAEGAEETPLDPVVDPLTQTLGYSEEDGTDGVAAGLSSVGDTLAGDESQLSPLTSDVLAPVVGTDEESGGSTGLSGTLDETGEGLTDLTNENSALAPLDPLTTAVSDMLVAPLSSGTSDAGDAFIDNAEMAGPGEELATTTGTLLGGETQPATEEPPAEEPPADGGTTGTPLDAVVDPVVSLVEGGDTPDTPLDPLTDALMENSDPAVLGESVGGVVEDIGTNTPLEPVTEPLADALAGGDGGGEATPIDDLLAATEGTPISTVTDPLQDAISPITGGLI